MRHILTAQAEALPLAILEAGQPRVLRRLMPGVALCEGAAVPSQPIFLRHCCPAEIEVPLAGTVDDLEALRKGISPFLERLGTGESFSVQTVIGEGYAPGYKRFDVNEAVSREAASRTGVVVDVKQPAKVLSVWLAKGAGWLGVSTPVENFSDWAGGMRRFKWEEEQVSRAEFKLLEALEVFGIAIREGGHALDLGAAPGGWTRILRGRGLHVVAVDPAELDSRVARDKGVTHVKATAQAYFRAPTPCDILVNDMKMDSDQSAALMVEGAHCLGPGGVAVLTLKLPEETRGWLPRVRRAEAILKDAYRVENIRQLFHNRSEVTVYLTRL